ncbi:ArsS family sensor histidine kinase [Campylobacter fetus]|uniref:histidine kinase n=1 Tax=Campylobacter fetus subsp. testudinum TaxID=1507806 RepID=A0AAX0HCK8_CAMFE|nr:ArsS family sensor histidine kinase [Campylobacter fetus]AGZ81620.1 two-component system sensor histidine kinase [Campylobacter fetus subsp. testudinum 03-427]AJB45360.1 ATPase [Campylobacter fetus subsp. testudinum]ALV64780.1 two-component system sensor histidine kinase [Campylobacter fetus subsp. testudinum Sp3]AVK81027.1 sensor histidine kinase [Campylobacter fetus subsp. testudinum]EAI4321403.1 HAMP domain-containing histidine kinase [Campylobacter fetus]
MKFSSIFYTITLIFAIATTSIFLAFLWLMDYDKQNYTRELNTKYSIVARATLLYMSELIDENEYKSQIQNFEMPEIKNQKLKNEILTNASILEEISADIGSSAILFFKKRNYLKIVHKDTTLLLQDSNYQPYRYDIIKVIFGLVFFILLITYIFIIRKIKPLRRLKRQIDKFANGDLNIKNVSTGNDEISEVADAFYNAVMQIKSLNQSRQLFLRNIMHELKTPITKGRITAEMIEKTKNQERLINVFERLESLINEFAALERVTSGIAIENLKLYKVVDIIDEATDIAMAEKSLITINAIDDVSINGDFKLLSIAFKNMIDNGIKYSDDKHINITITNQNIKFITKGNKLEQELNYYIEPFTQGSNAKKSFGLGLYIVDNILKSHNLNLEYCYKNGLNIFIFNGLKPQI